MRITKHHQDHIEGTLVYSGIESRFEAFLDGRIAIYTAFNIQGAPGFGVLATVEEIERVGVAPTSSTAIVATPPLPPVTVTPPPAEAPVPEAPKKPAAPKKTKDVPPPAPPAPPAPPVASDDEDPNAYIDSGTPGADSGDDLPPPPPSKPKPAPKAAEPAAPPVAAGPVAAGTEPYVDPARPEGMPDSLWNAATWPELLPAYVQWMFEQKQYAPGTTLESATEDLVAEGLKVFPIMPISKGAKPQTFTYQVLKTMMGKHVRACLANMQ